MINFGQKWLVKKSKIVSKKSPQAQMFRYYRYESHNENKSVFSVREARIRRKRRLVACDYWQHF